MPFGVGFVRFSPVAGAGDADSRVVEAHLIDIRTKDAVIAGSVLLFLSGILAVSWVVAPRVAVPVLVIVSCVVLLGAALTIHRRIGQQGRQVQQRHDQLESLLGLYLYFTLQPSLPLPPTRGWAASPDFLKVVAEMVLKQHPALVVEAGSGVSTLVIGSCLKRLGSGRLVSLEHEERYADNTRSLVELHGLADFVDVQYCPIKTHPI
jgi:hypothetical protein